MEYRVACGGACKGLMCAEGLQWIVRRRQLLTGLLFLPAFCLAADPATTLKGKLIKGPGDKPALRTSDGKLIFLTGDDDTVGVLNDARLANADFEVIGTSTGPDQFAINPIHTRAMFVHKGGKRLLVTYWCDVCAIRTYTPGICWCCRENTELDLRDPATVSNQ
jgi:hypothetical protein